MDIIIYGGVFVLLFPRVAPSLLEGVVRLCFFSSVFLRTWVQQQQQQLKLEKQEQQQLRKASRDSKSPVPAAVFFPFVFFLAVGGRWPLFSVG